MAENKKSFVLYTDLIHTVKKLEPETAGKLFLTILEYVNDLNPQIDNEVLDIAFEPIKQQLKRDLKKWDNIKEVRSKAGKISAQKRKERKKQELTDSTRVDYVQQSSTNSTVSVNDNVNVSVNVNDTVNENTIKALCEYFKISELKNFTAYRQIYAFARHTNYSLTDFNAYKNYKKNSGEKIHGWRNFIGTVELQYTDGAWCSCDWKLKLNGSETKPRDWAKI